MNKQTIRKVLGYSAASLLTLCTAHAQSVTVNNPSFEAQVLPTGGLTVTTPNGPTGWTGYNIGSGGNWDIGVQSAGGTDYTVFSPLATPAQGNNYLWLNRFNGNGTQITGVYQDVGSLLADTTYTLTVAIGQRNDSAPNSQPAWSPGIISLLNGTDYTGTVLATGGGLPARNTWQDYTVSYTTGATVSGDLLIDLSVLDSPSIQADFDNVSLTATPVPEPGAYALLGGGFILFSITMLRRKQVSASF
jgi:hypothetical protein